VERLRDRAVAAVARPGSDDTQEGDGGGYANHDDERGDDVRGDNMRGDVVRGDDGGDETARSGR
jgi:hypothetical protein